MTLDWLSFIIGLFTIPAAAAVVLAVILAVRKDQRSDGCQVCGRCPRYEVGQRTRAWAFLNRAAHTLWWSKRPAHQEAALNHWTSGRRPLGAPAPLKPSRPEPSTPGPDTGA